LPVLPISYCMATDSHPSIRPAIRPMIRAICASNMRWTPFMR
jgi:hypothetical protein